MSYLQLMWLNQIGLAIDAVEPFSLSWTDYIEVLWYTTGTPQKVPSFKDTEYMVTNSFHLETKQLEFISTLSKMYSASTKKNTTHHTQINSNDHC